MKTKTLLLTAALTAAGIASSMAQVYSVNAVGYVNVTVVKGFNLISNPLSNGDNTLNTLLPGNSNLPDDAQVQTWDASIGGSGGIAPDLPQFVGGFGWDPPGIPIPPGRAFFMFIPDYAAQNQYVITFVGEVMQSVGATPLSNPVATGSRFDSLSSQVPQTGRLIADLNFQAAADDFLYTWDTALGRFGDTFLQYAPAGGGWPGGFTDGVDPNPIDPTISVGSGFFLFRFADAPTAWTRVFSVNPTP